MSENSVSWSTGSSASSGNSASARSTRSRTFWRASSMSVPETNSTVTSETLSWEVEVRVSSPSMPWSSRSTRSVISFSTSSGEAPG